MGRGRVSSNADAGKLNCLRFARPAEARPEAKSATRGKTIIFEISFKHWVFWPENPRKFSGFVRRSFCEGRELRRPKSNHVHPAFSCFFPSTKKSHENPRFPLPLQIKDSWDHAQMIERKILCRIALTRALYDQIRP